MTVIFDLYFFEEKYIQKVHDIKKKQSGKLHVLDDIEFEVGSVICRNSQRKQPIFFYRVDELVDLLESGYEVSKDRTVRESELGVEDFPPESVVPATIEMDEGFRGKFIDQDGKETKFDSKDALKALVKPCLAIENE